MIADKQIDDYLDELEDIFDDLEAELFTLPAQIDKKQTRAEQLLTATLLLPFIITAIDKSGFTQAYERLISKGTELIADLRTIHKATGLPLVFTEASRNELLALQKIDLTKFGSVTSQMASDIHSALMDSVVKQLPDKAFIQQIKALIDEKYYRYSKTWANTSRNNFLQELERLSAYNNAKDTGNAPKWIYEGVVDNKNRDECVYALDKYYFTDDEMWEFEAEYGERYNCRHIFIECAPDDWQGDKPDPDVNEDEKARRDEIINAFNT